MCASSRWLRWLGISQFPSEGKRLDLVTLKEATVRRSSGKEGHLCPRTGTPRGGVEGIQAESQRREKRVAQHRNRTLGSRHGQ